MYQYYSESARAKLTFNGRLNYNYDLGDQIMDNVKFYLATREKIQTHQLITDVEEKRFNCLEVVAIHGTECG
jgi:hypothetical protein